MDGTVLLNRVYFAWSGNFQNLHPTNLWFACNVVAAVLVDRNNKICLLWEFTAIFMQTL